MSLEKWLRDKESLLKALILIAMRSTLKNCASIDLMSENKIFVQRAFAQI